MAFLCGLLGSPGIAAKEFVRYRHNSIIAIAETLPPNLHLASASPDEPTVNVGPCGCLVVEVDETKAAAHMWF